MAMYTAGTGPVALPRLCSFLMPLALVPVHGIVIFDCVFSYLQNSPDLRC